MTTITLRGADAGASHDYVLPFAGINYLNFYEGQDVVTRNLAGGPRATLHGAPVYRSGYTDFNKSTGFLTLDMKDPVALTFIGLVRPVPAADGLQAFIGSHHSSVLGLAGASLYTGAATDPTTVSLSAAAFRDNSGVSGSAQATLRDNTGGLAPNEWQIIAMRCAGHGASTMITNVTRGVTVVTNSALPRAPSSYDLHIGAFPSPSAWAGISAIASMAVMSRAASDEEVQILAQRMRVRAAKSGITA